MRHHAIIGTLVLLLAAMPLAGCGDNDNDVHLDTGSCGNGVVDQSREDCDGSDLDGATCASLGFSGGTLSCSSNCDYVTSACTGSTNRTPTPVATPTGGAPTATPGATTEPTATAGGPTATAAAPTATPTPGGPTCDGTESIVVTASLDADVTSARIDLSYPAAANLPGSGTDPAVKARVEFTGSGLTVVNDFDANEDLVDDTVTLSLVGTDVVAAGAFAAVTFDCQAGQPVPTTASFACTVVSASNAGTSVAATCSLTVQ